MKELSLILRKVIDETYSFNLLQLEHWSFKRLMNPVNVSTITGRSAVVELRCNDPFINAVVTCSSDSSMIQSEKVEMLSSLMKLHSLAEPKAPSQVERAEIYKIISDPLAVDQALLKDLQSYIPCIVSQLIEGLDTTTVGNQYNPLWSYAANPKKYSFCINSLGGASSSPRDTLLPYNINYIMKHPDVRQLYKVDPGRFITLAFTGVDDDNATIDLTQYGDEIPNGFPMGRIVAIPEPALKQRVVNQPHLLINSLSYNLGCMLKEINSNWAVQGVDSHDKCASDLSQKLKQSFNSGGKLTFHSIDMSNFTDRFPYKGFQQFILECLVNQGFIKRFDKLVFDKICEWEYYFLKGNDTTSYGAGTPQGTNPSFPLCSLANGIVLYISALKARNYKAGSKFPNKNSLPGRIIGDDTVIWDHNVALIYREIMSGLKVDISTQKSVTSPIFVEMCSKVIHPSGVFLQKKLKPIDTISSYISNYNYYGEDLVNLSVYSPQIYEVLRKVPKPYGLGDKSVQDLILSDELTPYELASMAFHIIGTTLKYIDRLPHKGDLYMMYDRYKLLPKVITLEREVGYDQVKGYNVLINSIIDSTARNFKSFSAIGTSLQSKIEICTTMSNNLKLLETLYTGSLPARDGIAVPTNPSDVTELIVQDASAISINPFIIGD
jgi:hypothetical protein